MLLSMASGTTSVDNCRCSCIYNKTSLSLKFTYVPYKTKPYSLTKGTSIVFVYFVLALGGGGGWAAGTLDCYMHFLGKLKGKEVQFL